MRIRNLLAYTLIPFTLLQIQACGGGSGGDSSDSSSNNTVNSGNQPNDSVVPTLYLRGSTPLLLALGEDFNDPRALAIDDIDGDISDLVSESNDINTTIAGCYTQSLFVKDAAGNSSSASRTVFVGSDAERHSPNTTSNVIQDAVSTTNYDVVNIDVLANDSDAECDHLTIVSVSQPALGEAYVNSDSTVS